jgi:hypothetical protein
MLTAVVHQGDRFHGKFFSVEKELICAGRISREPADRYMINGLPVAVVDFVGRPAHATGRPRQGSNSSRTCNDSAAADKKAAMTTAKLALRWGGREGAASNARAGGLRNSGLTAKREAPCAKRHVPSASRQTPHTVLFAPGALRSAQPKHGRGLHGPRQGLHGPRQGLHDPRQELPSPRVSAEAQKAEIREPIVSDNHRKLGGAFP